ncbi:unnamed protein product [marine sediment metagenome]|uniref:Aldehyde ferredoxin oxidoreductase N-terminal domain-containing protein n=1 Tax=marine sediment metagenome TaxID=412755 RepID=X1HD25_9ZZZZ
MPNGYMGKILWVNLTDGTFKEEDLPEEIYRQYLGGIGLAGNIDIDASKIFTENKKIEDIAEVLWTKLKSTCNGERTYAEILGFEDLAILRANTILSTMFQL